MLPILFIVISLPIIMGIVTVLPFEPPEIEDEQIQEIPEDENPESIRGVIIILLAIVWIFFIVRMVKVWLTGGYRPSIRKRWSNRMRSTLESDSYNLQKLRCVGCARKLFFDKKWSYQNPGKIQVLIVK